MDHIDKAIVAVFSGGVITVHRAMIDITGDLTAALMLEEIYSSLCNTEEESLSIGRADWLSAFGIDYVSQVNAESRLRNDGYVTVTYRSDNVCSYTCNKEALIDALAKLALPD